MDQYIFQFHIINVVLNLKSFQARRSRVTVHIQKRSLSRFYYWLVARWPLQRKRMLAHSAGACTIAKSNT